MEDKTTKPRGTTDRISGLPQPIIHHILSFLPKNNVVKGLSKSWYGNWTSSPYLDFDDFNRHNTDNHVNFITRTLQRFHDHNLQIRRLTISLTNGGAGAVVSAVLDGWIALALQHGVEELNLEIYGSKYYNYHLPPAIFDANSIKVAKFVGCSLLQSIPHDGSSSTNLVKLCLEFVQLNEVILSSIFSSCPLIEDLSIMNCRSINCVRISNLHKLNALQIILCTGDLTVEIDASCLQSLHIRGSVKIDILECPMLTHLDLSIYKEFNLKHILSRLSLLRSLCLSNMLWLTMLKVSSNILNELKIFDCYNLFMELEIDAPNLVSGGWGVSSWYGSFRNPYMVEDFAIELSNFVSKAKHLKYLCLQFEDEVKPFIFNEVNERPVANIDHLDLCIRNVLLISNELRISNELSINNDLWMSGGYLDLFDGLLWSCHPRTLSLKFSYNNYYYYDCVMKCMHRIIASHRHSCSCTLARSWLHHLEDVRCNVCVRIWR